MECRAVEVVNTPGVGTTERGGGLFAANGYPDVVPAHMAKMVLMVAETSDGSYSVAAAIRDRAVNEVKLSNAISTVLASRAESGEAPAIATIRAMSDDEVVAATTAALGFAGPLDGLTVDIVRIVDAQLPADSALICGANQSDAHAVGLVWGRDVGLEFHRADILTCVSGDPDPKAGKAMAERHAHRSGPCV